VIHERCDFIILAVDGSRFQAQLSKSIPLDKLECLNSYNVEDKTLVSIIDIFYQETLKQDRSDKGLTEQMLSVLADYYFKNFTNYLEIAQSENNAKPSLPVDQVCEFIENHLFQNLTIEEIALEFNLSKFYFLREFKRLTGQTPYQFLLSSKLERAKKSLTALVKRFSGIKKSCKAVIG